MATTMAALRDRVHALMPHARSDLAELVACKSVADPRQFPASECLRAAQLVIDKFTAAGMQDVHLEDTPDGHPAVYGHIPAPAGAPTVLLYCHYDVQPPLDPTGKAWNSPPFELTERDGRWYGRGASDCKGNIVAHLTALRALGDERRVGVKLIAEGSEEQGTGGLEQFVPEHADLLEADAIIVADTGNFALGVPTFTTTLRGMVNVVVRVRALDSAMHSGMFGGAAPDALFALIRMLATLRDAQGDTTIDGLQGDGSWSGIDYPVETFRADAHVLDGVDVIGSGRPQDMLWARPAVTVLGMDCPPVVGSAAAVPPEARARINLRIPPGITAAEARDKLVAQLRSAAPWNVRVDVEVEADGEPFTADTGGPAYVAMRAALGEAFGRPPTTEGQGGSIPLCNVLHATYPDAEIMMIGVEEPRCLIHAPNESVDPAELERIALSEALFLRSYRSR